MQRLSSALHLCVTVGATGQQGAAWRAGRRSRKRHTCAKTDWSQNQFSSSLRQLLPGEVTRRRSGPDEPRCYGAKDELPAQDAEEGSGPRSLCLEGRSGAGAYLCRWCRCPRNPACRCTGVPGWCWCRWRSHHTNSGQWRTHHALWDRERERGGTPQLVRIAVCICAVLCEMWRGHLFLSCETMETPQWEDSQPECWMRVWNQRWAFLLSAASNSFQTPVLLGMFKMDLKWILKEGDFKTTTQALSPFLALFFSSQKPPPRRWGIRSNSWYLAGVLTDARCQH